MCVLVCPVDLQLAIVNDLRVLLCVVFWSHAIFTDVRAVFSVFCCCHILSDQSEQEAGGSGGCAPGAFQQDRRKLREVLRVQAQGAQPRQVRFLHMLFPSTYSGAFRNF